MDTGEALRAYWLAESDRADRWRAYADAMWRDGYRAGLAAQAGAYDDGYTDAQLDLKAIQHGAHRDLAGELARWDGPRERFGDPRPGDYPGTLAGAA